MAIDSAGNVYVADDFNSRIQKFTADGEFLALWGTEGSGDGQLFRPEGVAIDHDVLYVSERGNSRVQKFTLDGQHLGYLFNGIRPPGDIAVDSHGNIIVAIPEDTVGKLSRAGAVLAVWGGPGSGPGQFEFISGVAVDQDDNIWVADNTNRNIQQFTNDGVYLRQIQVPREPGPIAVDSEPPRDCRRLQFLRGLGHGQAYQVLPRGSRASGPAGVRSSRRARLTVGDDHIDSVEDWVFV
jgi:DNA-binding beta-propeller fold protein YncE